MRTLKGFKAVALLLALLAGTACGAANGERPPQRVLFVGNSLTYVGNTPAVYAALASREGRPSRSDMIVRGGATLSQRVADGSVERALAASDYAALVIQERGGDLLCAFGPNSCVESRAAIAALSQLADQHDIPVVMLGTYQHQSAPGSAKLAAAEAEVSGELGLRHAEVSETLRQLREQAPDLAWFAADGAHPGPDLALLQAILVHRALHGALPEHGDLRIEAPAYGITTGLDETPRAATDPPPMPDITPDHIHYDAATVGRIIRLVANLPGARGGAPAP